jgi:hypothetical protein
MPSFSASLMNAFSRSADAGIVNGTFMDDRALTATGEL